MKFMKLLLTFALLAVAIAKVKSLQCYVCDENCEELTDGMLMECGPEATTTLPTTQPSTTSTTAPGVSSTTTTPSSTTTTTTTTTSAGTPTTVSNMPPITETTTTVSSSVPASSTTSTNTDSTTTAATTTPVSITTTTSTEAGTTTTTTGPTTISTPSSTPAASPTIADSTTSGTESTANAAIRKRRAVSPQQQAVDQLLRNYRSNSRTRRDTTDNYACYAINKKDGDSNQRHYGCILIPAEKTGCEAVQDKLDIESNDDNDDDCFICFEDGCNSSATVRLSAIALIGVLFMKIIF